MTIQPTYHWKFEKGDQVTESVNGKIAKFHKVSFGNHGQIGFAVKTHDKGSTINLGREVGQFGKKDFTIAFGMLILNTHKQKDLDIIGSRNVKGHGNWFSLRQEQGRVLTFEVDENAKGKNYAVAKTGKVLVAHKWCHIAIVREGARLKIYHDGILVAEGKAKSGDAAKIANKNAVRLGHYKRHVAKAKFEDLRIYNRALSEEQIQALLPPIGGLLKDGEIELTASDGARRIFTQDEKNLLQYSTRFENLRLGPNTGATIYKDNNFTGVSQKLHSNIQQTLRSKIKSFPKSIHIWRSAGEPFQGKWVIRAANNKFLSWDRTALKTADKCTKNELFEFNFNQNYGQLQLVPATEKEGLLFNIQGEHLPLIINDSESGNGAFSIEHPSGVLWLSQNSRGSFAWTPIQEDRTTFFRIAKFAANEGQVGDLSEGEVALYQHVLYHGHAWILSDNSDDLAGDFATLQNFFGLNNTTSSIRLGPDTGVTLFANENQQVNEAKRETQIEDFVVNQPDLLESQLGNDNISSLKIFKQISASKLFTSITSKLSQDYRMVGDKLEDFSAYRTILRLDPDVTEVEVSATDLTTIEVEDVSYEIDEVRSVTLKPNLLNQIMITSEADGIDTPALKFRTQDMAENERVVVSPAQEVHQQIAELKSDALWNAKDAQGKLIVDQKKHTKAEVASVQNTIKRVMSSVTPKQAETTNAGINISNKETSKASPSAELVVDTADTSPWAINFAPAPTSSKTTKLVKANTKLDIKPNTKQNKKVAVKSSAKAKSTIWEQSVNQSDFDRLLLQSNSPAVVSSSSSLVTLGGARSLRSVGRFFRGVGDAIKKATKVTIGFVNNVMNAIVDVAGKVVRFVLDTVQKVAEFVQAVIEKVVESVKQFIEFLRFLFDWDDILNTQRFIKGSINAAFDSTAEFVNSAKKPISDAINGIQNTVSDSIDGVIKSLGVDPSEVASKKSSLPEAAEWFMNKLFGSIGPGKSPLLAAPTNALSAKGAGSGAFDHLSDALNKLVVMAGVTMTEGMVNTIQAVIENPTRPELALATMLELVKELSIQALDITEDLILAILDAIVAAVKLFQDTLNAEIRIPFISSLFELIGAGKLSIINVMTILVAIPTTVVSKLMFGERPFNNVDVPKLVESDEAPALRNVVSSRAGLIQEQDGNVAISNVITVNSTTQVTTQALQVRETVDERTIQLVQGFGALSLHADIFSGLFSALLDAIPEKADAQGKNGTFFVEVLTLGLDWLSWLGSFPASPNNPGGFPYLVHKHDVSIKKNPQEYWQRVVWGYRTSVLALDTIFLGLSFMKRGGIPKGINTTGLEELAKALPQPKSSKFALQRLRRGSNASMGIQLALSGVDLVLTSIYLAQIPKKDKPGLEAANEVIAILPGMLGLLRLDPNGAAALGFIQLGKTIANYAMGIELLNRTVADLK